MAGALTSFTVKDGAGTSRTMRVWDESGAGTGPYSFAQVIVNGDGTTAPGDVFAKGQATMANSEPIVLASNQSTIAVAHDTSLIANGASGTTLTPKFAKIVASSSGATEIVALVSAKKIRVLQMALTANGTVNVKWQSHVTPTDKTGLFYEIANSGYVLPFSPMGWFETIAGEALDINLSANIAVGGILGYVEV